MSLRDTFTDYGFHLQVPLCNRCLHRRQQLLDRNEAGLSCDLLGRIPDELLSCRENDCAHFEEDEKQSALFQGLL